MMQGSTPSYLPFPTIKQDPALYFESHKKLFSLTQPVAIITYTELIPSLKQIISDDVTVIDINDYAHQDYLDDTASDIPLDRVALLQHSSGTTGLKKGVALTYRQIETQAAAYGPMIGMDDSSVVVSWLPLYHDMGLFTSFLIPLSRGASIVSLDAFEWVKSPMLLLQSLALFKGTHTWLPNFAFNHIVNATPATATFELQGTKAFISCSEPVKPATISRFVERFAASGVTAEKVQACYAMAEASFAVSQHPLDRPARVTRFDKRALDTSQLVFAADSHSETTIEMVSNGPAIPGAEIGIALPDGSVTTAPNNRQVGEIIVRGPFVFDCYYNNPEATQAARIGDWYKTGDVGFVYEGELYICGRTKELVIVHGRNYYLHDIEEIVSGVPAVIPGRAVAIGVEDPGDGAEEILLLVETEYDLAAPDTEEAHKELRRAIKRSVFNMLELMPRHVEFVPRGWLVKTTSGKISRVENLRRYREKVTQTTASEVTA